MLKKAVIVVSIASATGLALSPLAFASDYDRGHHHSHGHDYEADWQRHGHRVGLLSGVAEGVGGLLHGVGETLHPLLGGLL
ncbi:MAG TPA: hypothetical protein VH008_15190 [Pseudonocardia sp.]|jgi:hypothetical protein|nr:hypothetical protein [Pseudonocardia sp.]